ncbi:hypothetical protein QQS21_000857 [Conoideocrella luteorostrata]|uniref:Uncharacterized protein n=1 Tax=Conoideocrella luteorostrata TaxID=1105319 RepID=A0AAJ0CY53_9HYPO|nr:hypothetical protein QQS21_000857 [Conoideocrella luteorostrata]
MAESWINSDDYPAVTVTESTNKSEISVRQSRFLTSGDIKAAEDTALWRIPLSITGFEGGQATIYLWYWQRLYKFNAQRVNKFASMINDWTQIGIHIDASMCRISFRAAMQADPAHTSVILVSELAEASPSENSNVFPLVLTGRQRVNPARTAGPQLVRICPRD